MDESHTLYKTTTCLYQWSWNDSNNGCLIITITVQGYNSKAAFQLMKMFVCKEYFSKMKITSCLIILKKIIIFICYKVCKLQITENFSYFNYLVKGFSNKKKSQLHLELKGHLFLIKNFYHPDLDNNKSPNLCLGDLISTCMQSQH